MSDAIADTEYKIGTCKWCEEVGDVFGNITLTEISR